MTVQAEECLCRILTSCENGRAQRRSLCMRHGEDDGRKFGHSRTSSPKNTELPPGCRFLKRVTSYTLESMIIHCGFYEHGPDRVFANEGETYKALRRVVLFSQACMSPWTPSKDGIYVQSRPPRAYTSSTAWLPSWLVCVPVYARICEVDGTESGCMHTDTGRREDICAADPATITGGDGLSAGTVS